MSGALQVAPVAFMYLFERALQIDRIALLLVLTPASLGTRFRRRGEKYLKLRIGKDHAADVPAFHHHATLVAGAPLFGHQHVSHAGIYGDLSRPPAIPPACESRW